METITQPGENCHTPNRNFRKLTREIPYIKYIQIETAADSHGNCHNLSGTTIFPSWNYQTLNGNSHTKIELTYTQREIDTNTQHIIAT